MPVSGMALAYTATGGLLLFSGFKGSTIADTVKHILQGNLNVTAGETIGTPSVSENGSASGTAGNVPDVSATAVTEHMEHGSSQGDRCPGDTSQSPVAS